MTKYFDFKQEIKEQELNTCAEIIRSNGTVVFPTETVYGIGANALSEEAVKKIYIAKSRAKDNPLIVHISDKRMLSDLVCNITKTEQILIDDFMPGPFTLIMQKKDIIPSIVSANLSTVRHTNAQQYNSQQINCYKWVSRRGAEC